MGKSPNGDRGLVKHKITQTVFELKLIVKEEEGKKVWRDVLQQQISSMRRLGQIPLTSSLKDLIEDNQTISMIVSKNGSKTQREVMCTF